MCLDLVRKRLKEIERMDTVTSRGRTYAKLLANPLINQRCIYMQELGLTYRTTTLQVLYTCIMHFMREEA